MNEFEAKIIELLESFERSLERIAIALESNRSERAPNYQATLEEFANFDWQAIGATVEKSDSFGVATVIWQGNRYVRRSPENAYGATIYFSRAIGKDEMGRNQYERLITFKPQSEIKVRPISRDVENLLKEKINGDFS